jgi:hypothetical protein
LEEENENVMGVAHNMYGAEASFMLNLAGNLKGNNLGHLDVGGRFLK